MANSATSDEHERPFMKSFVIRRDRDRVIWLLDHPKRRDDLRELLWHFDGYLDPSACREIKADGRPYLSEVVPEALSKAGIDGRLHVMSTDENIDGSMMNLVDLLTNPRIRTIGIAASCIPGKLGFVINEYSTCFICKLK